MTKPVVCIVGPTGAGKTGTALELAKVSPCSVINMDSRQFYTDFPIITAQPSAEERAVCPHLLYGFLETEAKISAGKYVRMADQTVEDVLKDEREPIFVGGTGLYSRSFFEGMAEIPKVPEHISLTLQERCQSEGSQALYEELATIDLAYAAKIHPNDKQRITRALEVFLATGKTFSWWHAQDVEVRRYHPVYIGIYLPLAELEPLLVQRIDMMLEAGAVQEATAAFEKCSDPAAPGWSGIGCRELLAYLMGDISLDECKALWVKNTRAYAKRQLTWFRNQQKVQWFYPGQWGEIKSYLESLGMLNRKA